MAGRKDERDKISEYILTGDKCQYLRQQKPDKEEQLENYGKKTPCTNIYSMYRCQIEEVAYIRKSYQWLKKTELKEQHRGTDHGSTTGSEYKSDRVWNLLHHEESEVQAVQRSPFDNLTQGPGFKMLAGKAYMKHHNQVAGIMYGNIFPNLT